MTTELKIQKYHNSVSVYIYNWNSFSSYQKKSVASTVYKSTVCLKTNQNREDNVGDNENWPVFFI